MLEFEKHLMERVVGRGYIKDPMPDMMEINDSIEKLDFTHYDTANKYNFEVILRNSVVCRADELQYMKKATVKRFKEFLYGELYRRMYELEVAFYNGDRTVFREKFNSLMEDIV